MANKHVLNGITFLGIGETTTGQVGRYNNGLENIPLKHLPREREEVKYLQIITKTQRWWEKNILQIGEQLISNDGLRHASQTPECIGNTLLPGFPIQVGKGLDISISHYTLGDGLFADLGTIL